MPQHVYILTEEEYKELAETDWKSKYETEKEKRIDETVSYVDTFNELRNKIQELEKDIEVEKGLKEMYFNETEEMKKEIESLKGYKYACGEHYD